MEWCGVEGVSRLVEEKHKKQYNQKKSLQLLNNNRNRKEEENETICIIIKITTIIKLNFCCSVSVCQ